MIRLKDFLKSRKGKAISITTAAIVLCIAVLLVIFLNRPVAVQSSDKVNDQYATAVKLDKTALDLKTGDHDTLNAEVTPDNAKDKSVKWTSSDKSVATVSDGLITAQGEGTAEITASSINGKTDSCSVTVSAPPTSTTPSTDISSAESSSAPSSSTEKNSGSTKPTTPSKSGSNKDGNTKPTTPAQGGKTNTKPTTTTDTSATTKEPVNKDFYITVEDCNIQYNPAYRSIQAFIDVTSVNQQKGMKSLNVEIYRNDSLMKSGNFGGIGKNTSSLDVPFGVPDENVNGVLTPISSKFRLECSCNDTWFKTIKFSVDANGIYKIP